ncbi:ABC transporter ATP-binding protein [Mesorhizobium sp. LHD-90]|uniref:ABC transporter ATP-binding protein n=1 Tax=Mesorhizobium sp. LHD-90 TaxID=3071414 RepID=UPI0027DEF17B|nr:ABC transporter ATP-binding protein [Mesorhizobium sp. LHD-90]MDQ6438123.1 ABC transporter ATP-binding protein [Mesorhizobium sp. LHD-90]
MGDFGSKLRNNGEAEELVIEHVTHAYGELTVLGDVSLHVRSGEIVAIVGPSGCGKSTLLRIVGGLERPSRGRVFYRGSAVRSNSIAYVFQDASLLPWRSVAQNVALVLEHRPFSRAERRERVREALARVNLTNFANAFPRQLSGGMRQRTGIARALVVEPDLVLFDEPLSALDAQTHDLVRGELLQLWAQLKFSAVYVTHNLIEATLVAHRVVILSRLPGRVKDIVRLSSCPGSRADNDPEVIQARRHIWNLLSEDSAKVDQEVVHG